MDKLCKELYEGKWTIKNFKDAKTSKYLDIYQGEHKSTLAYYENEPGSAWAMGNIPHNAPLTFSKKQVPTIIKLLKMKNSPLVKQE